MRNRRTLIRWQLVIAIAAILASGLTALADTTRYQYYDTQRMVREERGQKVYTITTLTSGSISPSGNVTVSPGGGQSFSIVPATGFVIRSVVVDGAVQSGMPQAGYVYTFSNVNADHTISAIFGLAQYALAVSMHCHQQPCRHFLSVSSSDAPHGIGPT